MNARDVILNRVRNNQPASTPLPSLPATTDSTGNLERFMTTLKSIGGEAIRLRTMDEIHTYLNERFEIGRRRIDLTAMLSTDALTQDPHFLEDVSLAILRGHFGVAESGAVWITNAVTGDRVLPFICEHLVIVIPAPEIVGDLHEAYARIGDDHPAFGTFIAGPSKTADIEQSLVLGAHGPKSLTVILT